MTRRRHLKAATGLSEAARAIIVEAFEAGSQSYEQIAAAVLTQTGEQIGRSSVARYYPCWCEAQLAKKIELAAAERARELIQLPSAELEQALETLEVGRLYESLAEAQSPLTPAQALIARDRAARRKQKDRELNLEERKVQIKERAAEVADKIEARAKAAGKVLDPEVLGMIREEVYGLPA
jgi:hypothetical protein